jgi:hypothetical protein
MVLLRYLLMFIGTGLLVGAAAILVWDLYQILKWRKSTEPGEPKPVICFHVAKRLAAFAAAPLLVGLSIAMVPSGAAGVRVNQFVGTRPATLYPGVHWIIPLIETMEIYDVRDNVFTTSMNDNPKKPETVLKIQTREGLTVGMAVAVRYRLDPSKLAYIHANLPEPMEDQMIAPHILFGRFFPPSAVRFGKSPARGSRPNSARMGSW